MLNTTHGKEERFLQPCGCDTSPADQRPDHDSKLAQMFFADARPYNLEALPVNYSNCFGCGERTSHNELQKIEGDWYCDDCRLEMMGVN